MAPEQFLDASSVDLRSDIYSLGCLMYEWETGVPPFLRDSISAFAQAHLLDPPPSKWGRLPRSRFGADKIILKCLSKKPADRFHDCSELARALTESAGGQQIDWAQLPTPEATLMPEVGRDRFPDRLRQEFSSSREQSSGYAVVEADRLAPGLAEAQALMGLGDWQRAERVLAPLYVPEMTRSCPGHPWTQAIAVNYGLCLCKLGRGSEAVIALGTLAAAKDLPAEYYVNLSFAHIQANSAAEAEAVAERGLRVFPDDSDILGNLTIALLSQKKVDQALQSATRRLARSRTLQSIEELAGVLSLLGAQLEDRDYPQAFANYRQAKELLKEAKVLNPRYLTARFSLAETWFSLTRFGDAAEELRSFVAVPMDRSLGERWATTYAKCFLWTGLFQECVEFCERQLLKFPGSVSISRVRAEAIADGPEFGLLPGGQDAERSAYEFFQSVVPRDEERTVSDFSFLARLEFLLGRQREARAVLAEASRLYPEAWSVPFGLAKILLGERDAVGALAFAREAISRGPWQPPAYELLGVAYERLGSPEQAEAARKVGRRRSEEKQRLVQSLG